MNTTQIAIDNASLFGAIDNALATIVFDLQGHVIRVNEKFAHTMEYEVEDMIGLHHRTFCLQEFTSDHTYADFWRDLRQGKTFQEKIQRLTKTGKLLVLEATYTPVLDDSGAPQAIIKVATDVTDRETVLQNSTSELMAMVEQMTASTDEVLTETNRMAERIHDLNEESETVRTYIQNIKSIVSFVENIASQSKLLGLNAAIEAARAGDHGRGFSVVADEIRNMAETSRKSAQEISSHLKAISNSIHSITDQTAQVTNQVNTNLIAMNELKNAYDHIASTTESLASYI